MAREFVIRRLIGFARRHGWEGAAVLLFVAALAAGIGAVAAGAEEFAGSLVPAELLAECPPGVRLVDTADLDLDQITAELVSADGSI